jgi:hypothetical protein
MKTYTAYFYTDAEYASTEIEAGTPGAAQRVTLYGFRRRPGLVPGTRLAFIPFPPLP